jgi:glycosyltransferase involved in cell wall biosynthesis
LDRLVDELPKDVEMHFYGTGAMEKSLKEKKHPNVYFHGAYFRSQQEEVLGAAHVSVVTLSEGMYGLGVPSKTYNIMAAGRPVIYFGPEDGEIGLLIKEKGIGYIGWPEKWNVEELKAMGARARAVAEAEYRKDVILNKFIKALQ